MSSMEKITARAKEVAAEDFDQAKAFTTTALRSGSYMYPIKGILYFICHRSLWKPLIAKLVPTMTLSLAVVAFMFIFAYLPQLAILVFVNGPLAAFTTILLTLSESSTIITLLSKNFLIADALVDTFDGTLLARNESDVVAEGRQLKSGNDPINKLGKLFKSPFEKFTPKALIRYVMYLPLNFIPVVGTVIFVGIQGKARGRAIHARYFQLKKWTHSEQENFLKEHSGPYTAFGTLATLLELIPVASILFAFTNTVGAALWAADIEKSQGDMTETTSPNLRRSVKKAE